MRPSRRSALAMLLCATACGNSKQEPLEESVDALFAPEELASEGKPVAAAAAQDCARQSATGRVEFIGSVPNVNLGRHIIYAFSAIATGERDPSGACLAKGEFEERLISPEGELLRHSHATVLCLGVAALPDGLAARIGGKIDRVDPPLANPAITHGVVTVLDKGEGADDPPDEGSAVRGTTEADAFAHCAAGALPRTGKLIRGNVQVRP